MQEGGEFFREAGGADAVRAGGVAPGEEEAVLGAEGEVVDLGEVGGVDEGGEFGGQAGAGGRC